MTIVTHLLSLLCCTVGVRMCKYVLYNITFQTKYTQAGENPREHWEGNMGCLHSAFRLAMWLATGSLHLLIFLPPPRY